MARLVLVALVWSAVHGEEYGGGGMPQYGGVAADYAEPAAAIASADYTGHSPDASAPLDYKYIEHPLGSRQRFQKDVDGTNLWEKRPKERRSRHDKDELEMVDSETAVSKHKPSRRVRHRPRLKSEKSRQPRRRRNRNNRDNEDNDDVRREYMRNNDYRDEIKSEALDEEHIPIKETTERIIRRKARDRHFAPNAKGIEMESEDDVLGDFNKIKGIEKPLKEIDMESDEEAMGPVHKMKDEYNVDQNRRHGYGRAPLPQSFEVEDDDDIDMDLKKKTPGGKRKPNKNYPDYNNYYDMKRVYNIKNRLPMLLRRTTTRISSVDEDTDNASDLMKMFWTARRAGAPGTIALRTMTEPQDTPITTTTTTPLPMVIPLSLSTTPRTQTPEPIITTFELPDYSTIKSETPELSLAEKSRLSILKKAQRKESDKPAHSIKPPVLLQVTKMLPTIVMVEQPGPDPWMRARAVSNDSPERLDRVKRLMRQKLVSGSKNIKDLTDNWDEMICDYIDTSILDTPESQACKVKVESGLLFVCYVICYLTTKNV